MPFLPVLDRITLGRDSELVVYPDEGHGFSRRKNLSDYYERTVAFFSDKLAPK